MRKVCGLAAIVVALGFASACSMLDQLKPKSFNERLVLAYTTLNYVWTSAEVLLKSGKITKVDAQNLLEQTDKIRIDLDLAREFNRLKRPEAEDKLSQAITTLEAVKDYLDKRGKAPEDAPILSPHLERPTPEEKAK
jgi:hypothetical protein